MASELAITATTNQIELGEGRLAETSFTVTNTGGSPLRARVKVTPAAPALVDWFTIGGEFERSFPVDGTQQFTVQVLVPPTVATGTYSFRLDAQNVATPDEEYAQGPSVAFSIVDRPIVVTKRKGYVATLIGCVVGLLAGVAIGFLLGTIVGSILGGTSSGAGGIVSMALTWVLGLAGGVFGAGFALRLGNYDHFTETITALAVALPVWIGLVVLILFLIGSPRILEEGGTPALLLLCISGPIGLIVPPLAARAIVLFMKTGKL